MGYCFGKYINFIYVVYFVNYSLENNSPDYLIVTNFLSNRCGDFAAEAELKPAMDESDFWQRMLKKSY